MSKCTAEQAESYPVRLLIDKPHAVAINAMLSDYAASLRECGVVALMKEAAVQTLLSLGYGWNSESWIAPEPVGVQVPDAMPDMHSYMKDTYVGDTSSLETACWNDGWNACRAAMLAATRNGV